ncbi:MAG TPA: response regulator [Cyclobacteriaceae bacterium]
MTGKLVSIAIVDDDDTFQFITSKALRSLSSGNKIMQFSSGVEAVRYLADHAHNADQLPDVLLVDINMPVLDGWMVLDEFKSLKAQLQKKIAFYMVSSSIDEMDVNRAKDDSAVRDYIIKPISIEKYKELLAS